MKILSILVFSVIMSCSVLAEGNSPAVPSALPPEVKLTGEQAWDDGQFIVRVILPDGRTAWMDIPEDEVENFRHRLEGMAKD